jgi:hypothetical protein
MEAEHEREDILMLEVTAYSGLGPGIHEVTVTALETKQAKAGGDYLRWEFTTQDGKTTSANSSIEMTPGNKTGKWFAALTGRPTEVGQKRSVGEVIGKGASIVVELNPEGYPKVIALTARQAAPKAHKPVAATVAEDEAKTPAEQEQWNRDNLPF